MSSNSASEVAWKQAAARSAVCWNMDQKTPFSMRCRARPDAAIAPCGETTRLQGPFFAAHAAYTFGILQSPWLWMIPKLPEDAAA